MNKLTMERKTILLLGSTGMAGHILYHYLESTNRYIIVDVAFRNKLTEKSVILDIKNSRQLEQLIENVKPDYIINCIGILIRGSADTENAVFINAYLPHFLKKIAEQMGTKVIHLSTDCVFSGKTGNYKEDSFRDADDVYGRSKALGEIYNGNHLTIRTSIIGPELKSNGEGLFHWFMTQQGVITGYTNALWSGVTTLELAKAIDSYLSNDSLSGIVHLTNGVVISKYDLLHLFKLIWKVDKLEIVAGTGKNVNKSLAKSTVFKYEVPAYQQMLNELYLWMKNNSSIYNYAGSSDSELKIKS